MEVLLKAALEAANITGADGGIYNRNAKAAARSARRILLKNNQKNRAAP
jgi:hypothetical protein